MKKILIIIIFYLASVTVFAQENFDKYISLAFEHFEKENYDDCIELCERIIFFDNENKNFTQLNILIADAYNRKGDFRKAALYYNSSFNSEQEKSKKNDIIFRCALNYYLSNDTIFAYSEMYGIDENSLNNGQRDKFHLIMAVLDFKTGRYKSSKEHFRKIEGLNENQLKLLDDMFLKIKKINRKYNPTKVEWMSIVPGLGQLWCGYYKESANAFLITSAFYALFLNVSLKYNIVDGVLVVFPWFNRYYKGGVIKSYKLAEKKREVERNKILNKILLSFPSIEI
ncbi:MAG: hypothetical protein HUU47_07755 [Bacteroidetes bacterium]|nr:hypothetical protein [Bacteroidota bacterium]